MAWCQTGRSEHFTICSVIGIQADKRATLTEITTRYNRGMQQSIWEATTHTTLRRMGYNSRRPHRVPLILTTNRKKRLQFARAHQNWTVEDWKNVYFCTCTKCTFRVMSKRVTHMSRTVSGTHDSNATYLSLTSTLSSLFLPSWMTWFSNFQCFTSWV